MSDTDDDYFRVRRSNYVQYLKGTRSTSSKLKKAKLNISTVRKIVLLIFFSYRDQNCVKICFLPSISPLKSQETRRLVKITYYVITTETEILTGHHGATPTTHHWMMELYPPIDYVNLKLMQIVLSINTEKCKIFNIIHLFFGYSFFFYYCSCAGK